MNGTEDVEKKNGAQVALVLEGTKTNTPFYQEVGAKEVFCYNEDLSRSERSHVRTSVVKCVADVF